MPERILIVEDDATTGRCIETMFLQAGRPVLHVTSGEEGYFLATTEKFSTIVLDLCLPGRSGQEVLHAIRNNGVTVPVLVLSAQGSVDERVKVLRGGADDYLCKPFSLAELEVRVDNLISRGSVEKAWELDYADVRLSIAKREVSRGGTPIRLTSLEFAVFELLMRRAELPVAREVIALEVWKFANRATPLDNVIDVHVGRLRKKLDLPHLPRLIHTVRGIGFVLSSKEPA
jgi:DNA-binding response OmpR family regulator